MIILMMIIETRLPLGLSGEESTCGAGDTGSIPGSGRSPGGGNGSPLQHSCLENPMAGEAWRTTVRMVTKSDTTEGLSTWWPLKQGRARVVLKWKWKCSSLSRARLFVTLCIVVWQPPLSLGFSRQEYWGGLLCPPPGDLPNPGIEPRSPTLQADSLPSEPPGKAKDNLNGHLT